MKAQILVDGKKLPVNDFIETLSANMIDAIARSLKHTEGSSVEFDLQGEELLLFIDGKDIPLQLGSARSIVKRLLKGLLQSLHGTEHGTHFRFICDRNG